MKLTNRTSRTFAASLAAAFIAQATSPAPAFAQPSQAPMSSDREEGGLESDVPVAIQQLRRAMLSADVNTLTFRSMDTLFYTRVVGRSGPVWELPREDRALDFTYRFKGERLDTDGFFDRTYTNALLIMKDGKIVTEIYRNNSDAQTRFMSWSMAKSITSMLVGVALEQGRIGSLDDPITEYIPELAGSGYEGVTIRQILQMRSGVDYEERYDFENPGVAATNHENSLVRNVTRFADAARTLKRIHEPGSHFQYKTVDTAVLGWLVERAAGTTTAGFMAANIWEPLGAEKNGFFIMDGPPGVGREFTGAGYNATLRDYARLGQMMLNGGKANGRRILPAEWVDVATAPTNGEEGERGGYGYQWWTVPQSDAYYAAGLQGQYIYVDPKTKTVIVKLSYFPPGDFSAGEETMAFFAAASAWNP